MPPEKKTATTSKAPLCVWYVIDFRFVNFVYVQQHWNTSNTLALFARANLKSGRREQFFNAAHVKINVYREWNRIEIERASGVVEDIQGWERARINRKFSIRIRHICVYKQEANFLREHCESNSAEICIKINEYDMKKNRIWFKVNFFSLAVYTVYDCTRVCLNIF